MAEKVRSVRRGVDEPSARDGVCDDVRDYIRTCKGLVRCQRPLKNVGIWRKRATTFDIEQQGITDVLRQWQARTSPTLAGYSNRSFLPGNIIETEIEYVAGSQAQPGQKQQNRLVTSTRRSISFA